MLEKVLGFIVPEARPEVSERRREPRFTCDPIAAKLQMGSVSMPARVMDISRSGIRVEMAFCPPISCEVTLSFDGYIVAGHVRYSRPNSNQAFDVGLQLEDVLHVI
jgi:hypothetical protein